MEKIRLDKWLWLVRIYKTRNQAAQACNKKNVNINGILSKSSRILNKDDILLIKKNYIQYQYKVLDTPKSRIPAKDITNYYKDITLNTEKEKLILRKKDFSLKFYRDQGTGRPTKKERRTMDKFLKKI